MPGVYVFDHGGRGVGAAARALAYLGAETVAGTGFEAALAADALVVPDAAEAAEVLAALRRTRGDRAIGRRLAGGRAVFGIGAGMAALFDGAGDGSGGDGLGEWPGTVERADTTRPGWRTLRTAADSTLFAGVDPAERYYFDGAGAVRRWELEPGGPLADPLVTWSHDESGPLVAAVENGALTAVRFRPERSGAAGLALLGRWLAGVRPAA